MTVPAAPGPWHCTYHKGQSSRPVALQLQQREGERKGEGERGREGGRGREREREEGREGGREEGREGGRERERKYVKHEVVCWPGTMAISQQSYTTQR